MGQKRLPTVVDESAELFDVVYVSGGRRGLDLGLSPTDLVRVTGRSSRTSRADGHPVQRCASAAAWMRATYSVHWAASRSSWSRPACPSSISRRMSA